MSIKPITYQGASNFKANLYALEIRSRFIDQSAANGYYLDYGDELKATVSSNVITIGSGAFLVQGRLNEIEAGGETVTVNMQNGRVGYIIARIETYHPSDTENCTLVARTGADFNSIVLTQDDTYRNDADSTNKVYELPLYSFRIENGAIARLEKIIEPVEENTKTREIAQEALATITAAAKKIEEAYAEIERMLEQSYVENCGTAENCTTAEIAKSIEAKVTTLPKADSNNNITVNFVAGKTYILMVAIADDLTEYDTMMICIPELKNIRYSTCSAKGYWCRWYNQKLLVYTPSGSSFAPKDVKIREI